MGFLLDANIPYSAKDIFHKKSNVFHVRDAGLDRAADEQILAFAKKRRLVLVTRDLDFANIFTYPPRTHAGVVVLRIPFSFTAGDIKKVLARFLREADHKLLQKATTIVEPARFRIRR
ncbi:MAG: DUF5615 family PIN-like protein [Candidatus Levybacteria bacterium]|nr:DUF5615 family PIN-like protein [Candidatus Levybacteria bacterium]